MTQWLRALAIKAQGPPPEPRYLIKKYKAGCDYMYTITTQYGGGRGGTRGALGPQSHYSPAGSVTGTDSRNKKEGNRGRCLPSSSGLRV